MDTPRQVITPRACVIAAAFVALSSIALLTWYFTHDDARPILHTLLARMCHGTSSGKIAFFLAMLAASATVLAGASFRSSSCMSAQALSPGRLVRVWLGVTGLGLVLSLVAHAWITRQLDLSIGSVAFYWSDGVNSVSTLTHVHASKAPIALAMESLGWTQGTRRFDAGAPFAQMLPMWLSLSIGGAALCSFALTPFVAVRLAMAILAGVRSHACKGHQSQGAVGASLALTASVCAVSGAAKCVLDGGPLAYDAVLGLLVVAMWTRLHQRTPAIERRPFAQLARPALVAALIILGWLTCVLQLAPGQAGHQASALVERVVLLAALVWGVAVAGGLLRVARAGAKGGVEDGDATIFRLRWAMFAGSWAVAITLLQCAVSLQRGVAPLFAPAGASFVAFDEHGCATECSVKPGERAIDVYRRMGDDPLRARIVSFPGHQRSGTQLDSVLLGELIVLDVSSGVVRLPESGAVRIARIDPVPLEHTAAHPRMPAPNRPRFYVEIVCDARLGPRIFDPDEQQEQGQVQTNERFVAYHAIDAMLRTAGVREYVLVPYAFALK
ncbi:MAG: hypothetical protein SFZ23_06360 [Planctomycetota bacterium]|nr:hypothetical protein [Planctomycetota bacterium]